MHYFIRLQWAAYYLLHYLAVLVPPPALGVVIVSYG